MSDTDLFLQSLADTFCKRYFDNMPSVPIVVGKPEGFNKGVIAHFLASNKIEVHPNWASDGTTIQSVKENVKHELIHAWVQWKNLKGIVLKDSASNWHNEYFLWKAHQLGIGIHGTLDKYPQIKPVYERIQRGWNPLLEIKKPIVSITKRPAILSFTPDRIPHTGGVVTFKGRNLSSVVSAHIATTNIWVAMGKSESVAFRIDSPEQITLTAPPRPAGQYSAIFDTGTDLASCTITFVER